MPPAELAGGQIASWRPCGIPLRRLGSVQFVGRNAEVTTKGRRTVPVDQTHELCFEQQGRFRVYSPHILHELITGVAQIGRQSVGHLGRQQTGFEILPVLPFGRLQQPLNNRGEGGV